MRCPPLKILFDEVFFTTIFVKKMISSHPMGCFADPMGCFADPMGCFADPMGCFADPMGCFADPMGCFADPMGCFADPMGCFADQNIHSPSAFPLIYTPSLFLLLLRQ